MGQTTLILMIITVISKIFGFVRESVMAAYIGAGELKSVYTTSITIPTFFSGIVISAVASGYIPVYNKAMSEEGKGSADDFTNNLLNILMIFGVVTFLISFIFARPLSKLFSPGLEGESLKLATDFSRIMGISIFAFLYASVIRGYLYIKGNFIDPAISGIIINVIIIITIIITSKLGNPYILITGALLAYVLQFIRFPFVAKQLGFKYNRFLDFNNKYVRYLLVLVFPIIISSAADQLSIIVDNAMGSAFFGKDSVSQIFYAKTMLGFIMGVVTMTISTVTFPEIARLAQKGDLEEMKDKVGYSLLFSMLLVVPAILGMIILSEPIIRIAFERNAFTRSDTVIVSLLMVSYAPYIIFTSVIKIFSNAFYSVGDSKIPVRIVLIQQGLNFVLNFIFIKIFGIRGLAFATSISTAIGSILIIVAFYKKFGKLKNKDIIFSICKIIIISIIMALISSWTYKFLSIRSSFIYSLFITVLIAIFIYIILISVSKIEVVEDLKFSIKKKIKRNNDKD